MSILDQNLPYTGVVNPTLEECPAAAGSVNNGDNGLDPVGPYTPPDVCIGDWTISQGECGDVENSYQESLAEQALNASGAPLNIFKLLGVHEQGKMVDMAGNGNPIGSSNTASIFDKLDPNNWESTLRGMQVITTPAFIGYDFGIQKTSFGQPTVEPGAAVFMNIGSIRISQPVDGNRVLQARVESSTGGLFVDPHKITTGPTNIGNGFITDAVQGIHAEIGSFMLFASVDPSVFEVMWTASTGSKVLGLAYVGTRFNSTQGSFTIVAGTTPFETGDSFSVPMELKWNRVDVVNLPNVPGAVTVNIRQSSAARYWRLVPTVFQGVTVPTAAWIVGKLQFFQVGSANLNVVQDLLFMENRDRDYADEAIKIKVSYQPMDQVSDLSKFGFQLTDIWTFTTTFGSMVKALGRPIVVGDVLELPPELQYDHDLKPVRKFLEVTDSAWSADGYTTGWKPIIFKFQAQQLIPGQEHRDLFGDVQTQKYLISDDLLLDGIQQIQTLPLTATENNLAEALEAVPREGANNREFASGRSMIGPDGTYDGGDYNVEDGLPPDGQPYEIGYALPDVAGVKDRAFFRLEYDPKLKLQARLYQFSAIKNKWIHIETDRRGQRSSASKNHRRIFDAVEKVSPTTTRI